MWLPAGEGNDARCPIVAGERDCLCGGCAGRQHGAGGGPGVGIAAAARVAGRGAAGTDRRLARLRRRLLSRQCAAGGPARAYRRVPHRGAGRPADRRDDLPCGGGGAGAERDDAAAGGYGLGARRAIARSRRYSQISRIAVRHGLGPYLHGRPLRPADAAVGRAALALSLRQALEEGGVTFTKLGQLLSTRRDLLPEEFTSELAQLQDRAEPAPWEQVEQVMAQSLGAPDGGGLRGAAAGTGRGRIDRPGSQGPAARRRRPGRRGGREGSAARDPGHRRTGPGHPAAHGGHAGAPRPLGARGRHGRRCPQGSPPPCGKSSTSGWRHATWPPSLPPGRASSVRSGGSVSVVMPAVHEQLCTEHVLVIEWLDGVSLRAAGQLIEDQRA